MESLLQTLLSYEILAIISDFQESEAKAVSLRGKIKTCFTHVCFAAKKILPKIDIIW